MAAVALVLWQLARRRTDPPSKETSARSVEIERRPQFPSAGLLVPDGAAPAAGSTSEEIWDALEAAAVPVAVQYFPVTDAEIAKYRKVPVVNSSAQQAAADIVKALNPKSPTLYRVVLPKGAKLAKAAGTSGYRGFSRTNNKTTHAVLKPVAAGGAVAAGWPVLAVAGTVMAMDHLAQREQVAHQRRLEAALGRQEERHYAARIADQRSADAQLSRVISLMLDGREPHMELALKSVDDEFHRSKQFLDNHRDVIADLQDEDGKVDYRQLEVALGGKTKDTDHFVRELHLARSASALKRKALVADAASSALSGPDNPYTALQKFLGAEGKLLDSADATALALTEQLSTVELKGSWRHRDKSIANRQAELRARIAPANVDDTTEILYLSTGSGEVVQLIAAEDDTDTAPGQHRTATTRKASPRRA